VLFIDGGETPESETSRIRSFRPDLVILIDAARSGRKPGDIFLVEKEAIADEEVSTHRISLALLVRFIEESIGARVLFLGIEPESTEPETAMSASVIRAIEAINESLAATL
jgi:hydrogenase maturation protease